MTPTEFRQIWKEFADAGAYADATINFWVSIANTFLNGSSSPGGNRFATGTTSGTLTGARLTPTQQQLTNFTGIADGGIDLVIDGTAKPLTGLSLTGVASLSAVAAIVQAALANAATVTWVPGGPYFVVQSATTGGMSSVAFATPGEPTDIGVLMGLLSTQGGVILNGTSSALDYATGLYVAHMLAIAAKRLATAQAGGVPGAIDGPQTARSVDKVSKSMDVSLVTWDDEPFWNQTQYGVELYNLIFMFGAGGIQLGAGCGEVSNPFPNFGLYLGG